MKNIRRAAKLCLAKYALRGKVHAMPNRSDAEEHLRIIRSLMEKATIYRAISAEAAAVGGVLAVGASFAFGSWSRERGDAGFVINAIQQPLQFLAVWLAVLAIVACANLFFLWRYARKRGDVFISSWMKTAVIALLPGYLVAAFCTFLFVQSPTPNLMVPVWIVCHGLALLGTAHFAPRSLVILGWAFLLAGLLSIIPVANANWPVLGGMPLGPNSLGIWLRNNGLLTAQCWMAFTFGLFHLIYAACTWPRKSRQAGNGAQP